MEIPGENKDTASINNIRRKFQEATLVEAFPIAEDVRCMRFSVPEWIPHIAGQYYDVRLTSKDGYKAERIYSAGSAPEDRNIIELGVQLLSDGEVSPYLWNLKIGGKVDIRGPIGEHFNWEKSYEGPLCLIGGGSGMVPLTSMLRHYLHNKEDVNKDVRLLLSAKSIEKAPYFEELQKAKSQGVRIRITLTKNVPTDWNDLRRRVDQEMVEECFGDLPKTGNNFFVCGSNGFVESATSALLKSGFKPEDIKTERFGGV